MRRFLRSRVLFLLCMVMGLGLVFSGVTQAEITVSEPIIDINTGGNFSTMNYGECFFLLANPHLDWCEEEVGPDFYSLAPDRYRSPSGSNGCFQMNYPDDPKSDFAGETNVCFGNTTETPYNTLPVKFDGFSVDDFRVYRIDNDPDQAVIGIGEPDIAFAWSTIAGFNGGQYAFIPCPKNLPLDTDRFTTFDSEFVEDTAVTEIEINQTGSIILAYYFVNAANVCRVLSYELFINGTQMNFGIISDFQSGKYLVFDVEGLTGQATIRLETILISDPYLPPTWCPTSTIPGLNAHISGVFISNCVPEPPQEVCSIGDRVWEDYNGNGVQDCEDTNNNGIIGDADDTGTECDAGISGVTVNLVNCQTLEVLDTTYTDASGFYLFDDLVPGEYCVRFDLDTVPTYVCDYGAPQFTSQNAGNDDELDSDANPATGFAPAVVLGEGETNRSVDAGIRCPGPASLGDRVWEDYNGNGVQDCEDTNNNGIIGDADDTGTECDAGISGVTVNLVNCQTLEVLDTTYTDASGFYLFDDLVPGEYCVRFDLDTVPTYVCDYGAPQFTSQNAGNDDELDSDANPATGFAPAVVLGEGETNRSVDAGIVCQECAITIDKKCLVAPPAPGPFECDDKVDALKMIWNGPGTLQSVIALPGGSDSYPKVSITYEGGKQVVTVIDYQPSNKDVIWEWESDNDSGQSIFHLSCSDSEMNGSEDCGKPQGNGKSNEDDKYDNVWLLDGLTTDKGFVLDCTPLSAEPLNNCVFDAPPPPNCEILGKPTSLTFRYTGAGCSASSNNQGDKSECTGEPGSAPISITILKDSSKITVSPDSGINIGDLVTVSAIGSDMGSEVQLYVGGQFLKFHTSCSQPLAVDDVFGSMELVQFNGQSSGAEVTYFYEVKNIGDIDVDVTSVFDDKMGELLETQPFQLQSGESFILDKTAFISETTTNEVTAKANLFATDIPCGEAKDEVTVTVVEPTCDVSIVLDKLEDDKIKWKITNTSEIVATLETLTVNFPLEYGLIKEVKLDGGIFKKGDSNDYPEGVPSGSTIGQNDWTESDVSKRQLDPGETRTLEVVFTEKSKGEGWVLIDSAGKATFKEGCEVELLAPSGCDIGKPMALVFEYTGEYCVDGNDQDSDKWSCIGNPSGAEPVQVVMTKDADKFDVDPSIISLGETFEIRMKEDGKELPSEIKFDIRQSNVTFQSLIMHTSCSQPLSVGDQFGSVIVTEFIPKP